MRRAFIIYLTLFLMLPAALAVEEEVSIFTDSHIITAKPEQISETAFPALSAEPTPAATDLPGQDNSIQTGARDEFIDRMIALAKKLYEQTNGRLQPAYNASHIYICKNFTVHLFRENREDFRMAAYPDVPLVIPNNLLPKESKPYSYGIAWEDIPAEKGNPFVAAYSFYYNSDESAAQNRERALSFMREVKRGDFFQMAAKYYYGVGAHSLVFIEDYDETTGSVIWTDSNMKGESRGGQRYGLVQFDANKPIEWFVDAFCMKGRGATLYRLRDDIIRR